MIHQIVLLILADAGFQPVEYGHTRRELEAAGITVQVASTSVTIAHATPSIDHAKVCDDTHCSQVVTKYPEYSVVPVDVKLADVKPENYAGIFIVGGPGALEFLNNQTTYDLMKKFAQTGKPFGAICISPRILANAGLLDGKKATGWDADQKVRSFFAEHNVTYIEEPVVTDGVIVTAEGPRAATAFGKAIVAVLKKS
jgi:putative intracellular protease/amidase